MGRFRDFGDSTAGSSVGGRAEGAGIGARGGVVIATGAPVNRAIRKPKIQKGSKEAHH